MDWYVNIIFAAVAALYTVYTHIHICMHMGDTGWCDHFNLKKNHRCLYVPFLMEFSSKTNQYLSEEKPIMG